MSHPLRTVLRCSALLALALLSTLGPVRGQEKKFKELDWSHAFDLACRKFGEADITKDTKRWGVEAFRDNNSKLGLYISQTGAIALAPNFADLTVPVSSSQGRSGSRGSTCRRARRARRNS